MELVYIDLHRIAKGHLRKERSDHTLRPTALVNEAYLKLIGRAQVQFADRAHFFALFSQAMRRILVDHARARAAAHRRQPGERIPLESAIAIEVDTGAGQIPLLELDLALAAL